MKAGIIAAGTIVGLGVAGVVGYLTTMSYVSNRTMDYLHQQADNLNAGHYLHVEFVNESRGRFYSTAELTLARHDDKVPLHVSLRVYSGLFSTTIMALENSLRLPNTTPPLQQWNNNIDSASAQITFNNRAIASGDFKGSEGDLSIRTSSKITDPLFSFSYGKEGQLALTAGFSNYKEKGSNGKYLGIDEANLSLTYDAHASERIVHAGHAYIENGSADTYTALAHELLNHLPNVRLDMKEVTVQPSLRSSEYSAHHLVVNITPDTLAEAPMPISGAITGLGYSIYRRDVAWDMVLDGSVSDTLLTLLRNEDAAQIKPRLTVLAKSSPRLMVTSLRVTTDNSEPIVASGEIRFEGQSIASLSEAGLENIAADIAIAGLPAETIAQVQASGIRSIVPGQAVKVAVSAGHLYVNGQVAF